MCCEEEMEQGRIGVRVGAVDVFQEARVIEGGGYFLNRFANVDAATLPNDVELLSRK